MPRGEPKIATVVGARPQLVKAAVVSDALRDVGIVETLIHTGQHYDHEMSQSFFEDLDMAPPDYYLGVGSAGHGAQTGRMLEQTEVVLEEVRPDAVVVYGDTNSTLAGALAAAKLDIPVAHVEAGLRSFNRKMPEEVNRVVTDHLSSLAFAPTTTSVANLEREGIAGSRVALVGDVMYDVAIAMGDRARSTSDIVDRSGLAANDYVLATVHRAENTDDPDRLHSILDALSNLAGRIQVVWPVHPRTRQQLDRLGWPDGDGGARVTLLPPVGYFDMVMLESNARLIATDSGGVQKEAFFHGVPCVTLRDETEWTELVDLGWNRLAPPGSAAAIGAVLESMLDDPPDAAQPRPKPYGDGDAAVLIARELARHLGAKLASPPTMV